MALALCLAALGFTELLIPSRGVQVQRHSLSYRGLGIPWCPRHPCAPTAGVGVVPVGCGTKVLTDPFFAGPEDQLALATTGLCSVGPGPREAL